MAPPKKAVGGAGKTYVGKAANGASSGYGPPAGGAVKKSGGMGGGGASAAEIK